MLNVTVSITMPDIASSLSGGAERAVRALEGAVLAACEPYVPFNTGYLMSSGRASGAGLLGEVSYTAEYASACYYAARPFNRKKHPLAVSRWFEAAKAVKLGEWTKIASDALTGGVRG